ncbi:MAG: N-acetylmuramoyl-L-alanine amidase [Phycisphaerales bacterium]|nr:N-acetylmuramoyl-L-alanine amidase [Phycisphaerales bacterium]
MKRRSFRRRVLLWLTPWLCGGVLGAGAALGLRPPTTRIERQIERSDGVILPDPTYARGADYPWSRQAPPEFPIPPYAEHLRGVRIVLDPGHGGRGDVPGFKRGPTGLREAEVNLRVAKYLRDFLREAGASVTLTREDDRYLHKENSADLQARAEVANRANADLFLSIHHNAAGSPRANYSAVFYHGDADHSPASLSAARFFVAGLADALRLESQLPCPVLSDENMYETGFGVLRAANVPAVLTEASFYSNPDEETRLRDPIYNRREAYGLFVAIARWGYAGLPRVRIIEPAGRWKRGEPIAVALDDGLRGRGGWGKDRVRIVRDSFSVKVNGEWADFSVDEGMTRLTISPPETRENELRVRVDFENVFGQRVLHPEMTLKVSR